MCVQLHLPTSLWVAHACSRFIYFAIGFKLLLSPLHVVIQCSMPYFLIQRWQWCTVGLSWGLKFHNATYITQVCMNVADLGCTLYSAWCTIKVEPCLEYHVYEMPTVTVHFSAILNPSFFFTLVEVLTWSVLKSLKGPDLKGCEMVSRFCLVPRCKYSHIFAEEMAVWQVIGCDTSPCP